MCDYCVSIATKHVHRMYSKSYERPLYNILLILYFVLHITVLNKSIPCDILIDCLNNAIKAGLPSQADDTTSTTVPTSLPPSSSASCSSLFLSPMVVSDSASELKPSGASQSVLGNIIEEEVV